MQHNTDTSDDRIRRSIITFDSLADLIQHNLKDDHRSEAMRDEGHPKWYGGIKNLKRAAELAQQGIPRLGVEAIELAAENLTLKQGDLVHSAFDEIHDTAGATVDIGRYLEGVPECMIQYMPCEDVGRSPIVTLVMNVSYHGGIDAEAITENGKSMVALIEAVESRGKQCEVWTDMYVQSFGGSHLARTAVRLKRAGEPFDVSEFMYALSHPSFLRVHILNAMHAHPKDWRDAIGISPGFGYGKPVTNARDMEDFPPYSIYIPCISDESQVGEFVPLVLKQLGLTT